MDLAITLLNILSMAAAAIKPLLTPAGQTAQDVDAAVGSLLKIVASAAAAYQAQTGEPIDLDKLQEISPIE